MIGDVGLGIRSRGSRLIAAAALAIVASACARHRPSSSVVATADQNVLLITIDTLRADVLSCDGGAARTPNLDALAAAGARFTFAHAHAVMTLPSHASILTGEYPFQHGIRDNSGYRLPGSIPTLAARLKPLGFATGAFVGAFPVASQFGLNAGFDVYDDRFSEAHGPSDFTIAERRADAVVAPARTWIGAQHGRWFAWVHVYDPHAPYRPPAPFNAEYSSNLYAGEVAYTDSALGPLVDDVKRAARPTLVVVTGDHGEALGDHGELTHGLFAYEPTLRIPLIVAQFRPGEAPREGRVISTPARHVDLVPTVLAAVGATAPSGLPGRSLMPALNGAADANTEASYFESMSASLNRGWAPLTGVLLGREKYIDLPIDELYDLASDPGEQSNLKAKRAGEARVLAARLRAFHAALPGERVAEDPETAARLRSLGYTSGNAPRAAHYTERDDPKNLVELDRQMHRAIELVEAGEFEKGLEAYKQIAAERPEMPIAAVHLSYLYWKLGRPAEAVATLRGAWNAGLRTDEIRTQLGIYLSQTGDARAALPLLEPVATSAQPDADALNALGIAYAGVGKDADALETFARVLDIDRSNHLALENIGAVHLQRGRIQPAREAFERALAIDPQSSVAYNGLGVVELKSRHPADAIENWTRAVQLDPANYDALYDLATELLKAGRAAEARPYLERFVRTAPAALYAPDIARLRTILARMK